MMLSLFIYFISGKGTTQLKKISISTVETMRPKLRLEPTTLGSNDVEPWEAYRKIET